MKHSDIWFATPKRLKSAFKILVMDDTGVLEVEDSQLSFTGCHASVAGKIRSVSSARQTHNWPCHVAAFALLLLPLFAFTDVFLHHPVLWSMAFAAYVVGTGLAWRKAWVRVELDTASGAVEAYFTDGRRHGWSGLLDRRSALQDELTQAGQSTPVNPSSVPFSPLAAKSGVEEPSL
jgi:hypothetical protein